VTFTASGNATVSQVGGVWTVHLTGAGSATITAQQAGNSNYNAASNVARPFVISKANQTITFAALPAKTYGNANFAISTTSSSGLPVIFTASGNATIALVGGVWTVHLTGAGSATITAHQTGNSNYNVASNVSQTLTINKATPVFSNLSSPGFTHGSNTSAAISGSVASGTTAATGSVTITITGNGVNLSRTVNIANGDFSTDFSRNWAAGAYTVAYEFAGNSSFNTIITDGSTSFVVS
jgi:uncharacterized metal-binding protein